MPGMITVESPATRARAGLSGRAHPFVAAGCSCHRPSPGQGRLPFGRHQPVVEIASWSAVSIACPVMCLGVRRRVRHAGIDRGRAPAAVDLAPFAEASEQRIRKLTVTRVFPIWWRHRGREFAFPPHPVVPRVITFRFLGGRRPWCPAGECRRRPAPPCAAEHQMATPMPCAFHSSAVSPLAVQPGAEVAFPLYSAYFVSDRAEVNCPSLA